MTGPCGKLTCQEVAAFLLEYVDGTLPADQRPVFEQHTHLCRDCHVFLDNYKRVIDAGKDIGEHSPDRPVPPALIQAVLTAGRGRKR